MQNEERAKYYEDLQAKLFGERYRGACLSQIGTKGGGDVVRRYDAAFLWSRHPKNFFVLTGPPGSGKTYFCAAILPLILPFFKTYRIWNEKKLLERIREGINAGYGDYLAHLNLLIDDELVMIDDVGSSGRNDWREEVLFEIIDSRYKDGKATIFTSNLSKNDFYNQYHQRLASRLFASQNTIIDLSGVPDHRQNGL